MHFNSNGLWVSLLAQKGKVQERVWVMWTNQGWESGRKKQTPEFKSGFHHSLAMWTWKGTRSFWKLSFLICKMSIVGFAFTGLWTVSELCSMFPGTHLLSACYYLKGRNWVQISLSEPSLSELQLCHLYTRTFSIHMKKLKVYSHMPMQRVTSWRLPSG